MNIRKSVLISSAALLAFSFAGCSKSGGSSESESKTNSPESISFEWQAPFEAALSDFRKSPDFSETDSAFDITDITGDGVPELIISPNTDSSTRARVFILKDGAVTDLGELGNGGSFEFMPALGVIRDQYIGDGFVIGQILSCNVTDVTAEFTEVLTYSDNSASASTGASIYHRVNGEDLLLPDYEAALKPYESAGKINVGRKFSFGDSAVTYALKCSESWGAVLTPSQRDLCKTKLSEMAEESAETDRAFELSDLNGDKIPELIISDGSDESAKCTVYYFTGGTLAQMDGEYGCFGTFTLDPREYVFFYNDGGKPTYWSIANAAFSADNYDNRGNSVEIGRKYLLISDSIPRALS